MRTARQCENGAARKMERLTGRPTHSAGHYRYFREQEVLVKEDVRGVDYIHFCNMTSIDSSIPGFFYSNTALGQVLKQEPTDVFIQPMECCVKNREIKLLLRSKSLTATAS